MGGRARDLRDAALWRQGPLGAEEEAAGRASWPRFKVMGSRALHMI